jgi:hypothetical protein
MTNAERQKRYREKQKALRAAHAVTKSGKSVTEAAESVTPVTEQWDRKKYPVKEAWDIAVARAERARKYALMFPHLIFKSDLVFQDVGWQYENEGLKSAKAEEAK